MFEPQKDESAAIRAFSSLFKPRAFGGKQLIPIEEIGERGVGYKLNSFQESYDKTYLETKKSLESSAKPRLNAIFTNTVRKQLLEILKFSRQLVDKKNYSLSAMTAYSTEFGELFGHLLATFEYGIMNDIYLIYDGDLKYVKEIVNALKEYLVFTPIHERLVSMLKGKRLDHSHMQFINQMIDEFNV